MEIAEEFLSGAKLLKPQIFEDGRGCFFESYNKKTFAALGINADFVQDNESFSARGVLRGMHFQKPPHAQAKLIRVLEGEVEDIILDLRFGGATFGQYKKVILSSENKNILFVPRGFAHGFHVLSASARLAYKCDNFYEPSSECGFRFDDKALNLPWSFGEACPIVSGKDLKWGSFSEYIKNPLFKYDQTI